MILGPFDEVGDDQEIARETHPDDDADLELQALEIVPIAVFDLGVGGVRDAVVHEPQPGLQALVAVVPQHLRLALAITGEAGEDGLALGRCEGGALRDDRGVGDRLGQILEQCRHRTRRLQPRLGRGAAAVGAVHIGRVRDAEHRVVCLVEAGVGEAGGVGRDQRQVACISEIDQRRLGGLLDRLTAPRQLDVETIAEQRLQTVGIARGMLRLPFGEQPGQRALARAR